MPRPGAIGVSLFSNHVVYVEEVKGSDVYISEMNFYGNGGGFGIKSFRWASTSDFGYIY